MKVGALTEHMAAPDLPTELERSAAWAALAALAAAAGVVEGMVTLPVPFLRLGVANVFILAALWRWGFRAASAVAAVKVAVTALALGTLVSPVFPMNAGGTLASLAAMTVVAFSVRRRAAGIIPASALGGAAHAAWQVAFLYFLTRAGAAAYIAPPLVVWGFITGVAVGWVTVKFLNAESGKGGGIYARH